MRRQLRRVARAWTRAATWIAVFPFLAALLVATWTCLQAPWSASITLVRPALPEITPRSPDAEPPAKGDIPEALLSLLQSRSTAATLREQAGIPASPSPFAEPALPLLTVGSRALTITTTAATPQAAARLANAYGAEAQILSARLQVEEHQRIQAALAERLASVDRELEAANRELMAASARASGAALGHGLTNVLREMVELDRRIGEAMGQSQAWEQQMNNLAKEIMRFTPALVSAREALDKALMRYTSEHPRVKELQAGFDALQAELQARGVSPDLDVSGWANPAASALYLQIVELRSKRETAERELADARSRRQRIQLSLETLPVEETQWVQLLSRGRALQEARFELATRQQRAALPPEQAEAGYRVLREAQASDAVSPGRWSRAARQGVLAGLLTGLIAAGGVGWRETRRRSIRTPEDLADATGLPVLAVLGDLTTMTDDEKEQWAYRTFAALKAHLTKVQREPLVCGFMAARPGEGCGTWIRLLADAARRQGFRVVTVEAPRPAKAIGPGPAHAEAVDSEDLLPALAQDGALLREAVPRHVELPSWEWNLAQCQQWRGVVERCVATDYLIVLTKLPPASVKESIMLAQEMPNLLWLGANAMADRQETESHLALLRGARCRLVGAVLNRVEGQTGSWLRQAGSMLAAAFLLGATAHPQAQTLSPPAAPAPSAKPIVAPSLSATSAAGGAPVLADWQKKLTLGPGDAINVSIYGQDDTARPGLVIGPDGRINYLEARDFLASGLSIDELRKQLEEVLGKYHRSPRVIVTPVSYQSKKYYVLGNVARKGVFPLDRPVTIVEAVARCSGFLTSEEGRNAIVQADLQRAFMVRRNPDGSQSRVALDFEGLFQTGDLSQNLVLAPEDYLFFPPLGLREIYVLGQVRTPGPLPLTVDLTIEGAIAGAGGFTDRAWKSKVLLVRGSLAKPEGQVVDVIGAVKGKRPGTLLQNRDILYVSERPFARVEELIYQAVDSFAYAFVVGTTARFTPPIFTEPIIP